MTFNLRHLLAALILHALLIAVLAGGLQCTRKPTRPPVINAVLLDPDRKEVAAQKKRSAEEQRRRQEQERKRQQAEKQRQEQEQQKKLAEEQKKRDAEQLKQKAAADAQRKKAEDAKRQKELAEKKKADDLAKKKQQEEEQRERQEAAKRELQEKARLEEELRREEIAREAEIEQEARAASERDAKLAQWKTTLENHVSKYWNRPGSGDFECDVKVQQLPDGTVVSAQVVRSCGNSALDQSVQDAVFRASPLPKPADPSIFDRNLIITFVPR